jgi:hypothetical protein
LGGSRCGEHLDKVWKLLGNAKYEGASAPDYWGTMTELCYHSWTGVSPNNLTPAIIET